MLTEDTYIIILLRCKFGAYLFNFPVYFAFLQLRIIYLMLNFADAKRIRSDKSEFGQTFPAALKLNLGFRSIHALV